MSATLEKKYCRVLTVAGSDSGGGAGLQADLKTFAALGCYGMSAVTALTAQNTVGVQGILEVPADFVGMQIDSVVTDLGVDAVKTGMLGSAEIIEAVAERLVAHRVQHLVVDPVMVAHSGDPLLKSGALSALRRSLMPLAEVITPNLHEAEILIGRHIGPGDDLAVATKQLADMGAKSVLIKGGHIDGKMSRDCLYTSDDDCIRWFEAPRIATRNLHGTGCTLAAAVAAFLAQGFTLVRAVENGKNFITRAIDQGRERRIGRGSGPVHHFHSFW